MILMVPVSPEVPKPRSPQLWPGLVLCLILGIVFLEIHPTLVADAGYVEMLGGFVEKDATGETVLKPEAHSYLKLRPLLKISPSRGDWDLLRLFYANFIHGSVPHLIFNLIGAFAGARLCATFLPFACTMAIYLLGGSLGLFASMMVTSQISNYIPHLGSSAGIFAMMGTYYVYNFRYRTRYFFWFPSRQGQIALKTSTFFFFDVILLEIVLSAVQLFPGRLDVVDHIAHVVGFAAGVGLAFALRAVQRWPSFLQTRGEFLYWTKMARPREFDPVLTPFNKWLELLAINAYNDQVKARLYRIVYTHSPKLSDEQLKIALGYLSPTYIRLYSNVAAAVMRELVAKNRKLSESWLSNTPYDSIIRIARLLADPPEDQNVLFRFVSEYRRAHPEGGDIDRKLELLLQKLSVMMPQASGRDGIGGTATGGSNPLPKKPGSTTGKAKQAS